MELYWGSEMQVCKRSSENRRAANALNGGSSITAGGYGRRRDLYPPAEAVATDTERGRHQI